MAARGTATWTAACGARWSDVGYRTERDRHLTDLFDEGPTRRFAHRVAKRVGDDLRRRVAHHTPIAKPPTASVTAEWLKARGRRPGHLRDSWQVGEVELLLDGEIARVPVFTLDPVAPHVEWDTAPHLIAPKQPGGVLRYWDRAGGTVFATLVHHPGTRGVHMMATALAEVAVAWTGIAEEELRQWRREQLAI